MLYIGYTVLKRLRVTYHSVPLHTFDRHVTKQVNISLFHRMKVLKTIYGMDEKLLVFYMKLKTGYFGISKLDRTLYMLIYESENIGFLLDKELEVFYNTTHMNTDKILSISSS